MRGRTGLTRQLLLTSVAAFGLFAGAADPAQAFMGERGGMTRSGGMGEMGRTRGMGGGRMEGHGHRGMRGGGGSIGMGLGLGLIGSALEHSAGSAAEERATPRAAQKAAPRTTKKITQLAKAAGEEIGRKRFDKPKKPKRVARRADGDENKGLQQGQGKKADQEKADEKPKVPAADPQKQTEETPKTPVADSPKEGPPPETPKTTDGGDGSTPTYTSTGKRRLSIIHIDNPGKEETSDTVDCGDTQGKIAVNTGVEISWKSIAEPGKYKNNKPMIAISYTGANCDNCMWVQFVWSDVVVRRKTNEGGDGEKTETYNQFVKLKTTAGMMETTLSPELPKWIVDSGQPMGVAYSGTSNADATSNVIFDKTSWPFVENSHINPETGLDYLDPEKKPGTTMEWHDHFETFLICNGKPCAKVTWNATWTWSWESPDEPEGGPKYTGITISKDAKLDDGQYRAIADKFLSDANTLAVQTASAGQQ